MSEFKSFEQETILPADVRETGDSKIEGGKEKMCRKYEVTVSVWHPDWGSGRFSAGVCESTRDAKSLVDAFQAAYPEANISHAFIQEEDSQKPETCFFKAGK